MSGGQAKNLASWRPAGRFGDLAICLGLEKVPLRARSDGAFGEVVILEIQDLDKAGSTQQCADHHAMDDKQRDEELVARAYIDALQRHAGPPTHAPSSHHAAQPPSSADVLSVLGLLGRLSGDSAAAHPCLAQRSAQSAFHSYAANSAPQRQQVVEPVEAEPVHKHLEAVSFWIQVSGFKAALRWGHALFLLAAGERHARVRTALRST